MAHLLFIDESGQDQRRSPNEVLAGIAVKDSHMWSLITAIREAEVTFFGRRITRAALELKATKLLKRKVFRHAAQELEIPRQECAALAAACLAEGRAAREEDRPMQTTRRGLTALAQAKIAFCLRVFELCGRHQAVALASIVPKGAPRSPRGSYLRKDYAYLFERFYNYLEEQPTYDRYGFIVFDELERSQSHILVDQRAQYFQHTRTGRLRSRNIVPEPLFVHSDLTSLVQVADLIAYVISWGVRVGRMPPAERDDLADLAQAVCHLRHRAIVQRDGRDDFVVWG